MFYTKNGCVPRLLPESDWAYVDGQLILLKDIQVNPASAAAAGWEAVEEPETEFGSQALRWIDEKWVVETFDKAQISQDVEDQRQRMLDELANVRWMRQQVMSYNGRENVLADDVTSGRILGLVVQAQTQNSPSFKVLWKFGANDFQELNLDDLIAYGMAISVHMQACFVYEASLADQIKRAPDAQALADIDLSADWPN